MKASAPNFGRWWLVPSLVMSASVSSAASAPDIAAARHDTRSGWSRMTVTVDGLVDVGVTLFDPNGRTAEARGLAAHSEIPGCRVTADPTLVSGDCELVKGRGTTFVVENPRSGTWVLNLRQDSGRCRARTGIRVQGHGRADSLPAHVDGVVLAARDSASWQIVLAPRSRRASTSDCRVVRVAPQSRKL